MEERYRALDSADADVTQEELDNLELYHGQWNEYKDMLDDVADTLEVSKTEFKVQLSKQLGEFGASIETLVADFKNMGPWGLSQPSLYRFPYSHTPGSSGAPPHCSFHRTFGLTPLFLPNPARLIVLSGGLIVLRAKTCPVAGLPTSLLSTYGISA